MSTNMKIALIELTASSDFQTAGKQHVGRVTGPDPKWGLALEFVGARSGKRGDVTTAKVTAPGVYRCRSTTRKGTDDTYVVVWRDDGSLVQDEIDEQEVAALATDGLSTAAINAAGRRLSIEFQERKLLASVGTFGILQAGKHARSAVREARRQEIARLRGEVLGELPIEIDRAPSDRAFARAALESERAALFARLVEIDAAMVIDP